MTTAWRCEKCGEHMFEHGLRDGKPVCPERNEGGQQMTTAEKRIAVLEAERDAFEANNMALAMANIRAEAERDAIRAKTFEECARICDDQAINADTWQETKCARELGDSIRALAQTDEGKTESGE